MASDYTVEDDETRGVRVLIVRGAWNKAMQKLVGSGKVNGLDLNYARGFQERTLDFLQPWPLRYLNVLARTISDHQPIYRLAESLEQVSLQTSPLADIDLGRLPRLRRLDATWRQVRATIHHAPDLERLFLLGYDEEDLSPLRMNARLVDITFKEVGRMRSLNGIHELKNLKALRIFGNRMLTDIDPVGVAAGLRELELDSCSSINDLAAFAPLHELRFLNIGNCGLIESLAPLRGLRQLEALAIYESTRVADGDLAPLLDLPRLRVVGMKSRAHYRPSVREIDRILDTRNAQDR